MKKIITIGIVFLVVNAILVCAHIELFQSQFPFSAFGSLLIHLLILVNFPYTRFFKPKTNK